MFEDCHGVGRKSLDLAALSECLDGRMHIHLNGNGTNFK